MATIFTTNPNKTADTSFATARYIAEDKWGVTPVFTGPDKTAPTNKWQEMRFTGETLTLDRQTTTSNEIRKDRQVTDLVATNVETGGTVSGEFSYNTYDDFICAVMINQWVPTEFTAAASKLIKATAITGTGTDAKLATFDFTSTVAIKFVEGQLIKVSKFAGDTAESPNNGVFMVRKITKAGTTYTLHVEKDKTQDPDSGEVATGDSSEGAKISVKYLLTGFEQKDIPSYSIEKWMNDVDKSILYTGMCVDKLSFNVEHENLITVELSFMGEYGKTGDAEVATGIVSAGKSNIYNAGDNGGRVEQDDVESALIANMTVDIMNNLRGKSSIGRIGNFAIGVGQFIVNGSITLYFKDRVAYDKFLTNEETSIRFNLLQLAADGSKTGYGFYIPRAKYATASVNFDSNNSDVMMEGSYQGLVEKLKINGSDTEEVATTIVISKV